MNTHHPDGEPFGVESQFTALKCRLLPLVALAYMIAGKRTGDHEEESVKALAEGVIAFGEDLEEASEAASDEALGLVRKVTRERVRPKDH